MEEKFYNINEKYSQLIISYNKINEKVAYLRLLTAGGIIYFTYKLFKGQINNITIGISILLYLFLGGLVIYHGKIKEKIEAAKAMVSINNDYLKRISGEWINFKDTGDEFIDKNHAYSCDLDIVGKESLFQLINITSTWKGRQRLAESLLKVNNNKDEILQNQRAVEELSKNLEFCELMEYQGRKRKKGLENPERLIEIIQNKKSLLKSKILKRIIYIMPMITIPLSIIIIVFKLDNLRDFITIMFVIQLLIWSVGLLSINKVLRVISYFRGVLENYLDILKLLEMQKFNSLKLEMIYNNLFLKDKSAIKAIGELTKIADKIDIRNNGLFFIFLNGIFLWDYQCIFSFELWKEKYGYLVEEWLNNISEVEALMSISVLNHINNDAVFPELTDEEMTLKCKEIGHPLIQKELRVNNNIEINNSILIITGSNMSGKTTFLRTLGINLVIAYCGGAVCAKSMKCSNMKIYTSMRINDDLKAGISTFYGELVRIKNIIQGAKTQEKMIFLIDEIFRGTNSKDRIDGAKAVIKNLNKDGIMGVITTHDLELCNLEKENEIINYHFEEYYREKKIYFDYILRSGMSTTTNARYLMEMVGIEL